MMSRYIHILFVSLLFSCTSVEEGGVGAQTQVSKISIDPMIQTRATESDFESGDKIGVSIVKDDLTLYVSNAPLTLQGSLFSGDVKWYEQVGDESTITAYYPYVEGESMPEIFDVNTDQSTHEGYSTSELMIAQKSGVKPSSQSTLMMFYHQLCRIVISINNTSGREVSAVVIGGTIPSSTIDIETQSVDVNRLLSQEDIKALKCDDETYKAIFIPQSAALSVTIIYEDGGAIEYNSPTALDYIKGGDYTAEVILFDGGIDVTISGGIIDTETDSDYEEFESYFVYNGESYTYATFGEVTVMTQNLRYIPDGVTPSTDPSEAATGGGMWYPYKWELAADADPDDYDELYDSVRTALTDEESIKEWGYFYSIATAMGLDEITEENRTTVEGIQGICPPGWHIPTGEEWYRLCGDSQQYSADDTSAPFYDGNVRYGSVQRANELGFNHNYAGVIMNDKYGWTLVDSSYTQSSYVESSPEDVVGLHSTTYYMSSTSSNWSGETSGATFYVAATSHASAYGDKGGFLVQLGYSKRQGHSLRCVKDNE